MKIDVKNKVENPLFDRTEISFEVLQDGPTPSRAEILDKLVEITKAEPEMIVIEYIRQPYGMKKSFGKAKVYKNKDAMKIEHKYLMERTKKSVERIKSKTEKKNE